ncbi:MAG: peptidoglycan-binding protein [Opitutus sp.]|nr:peptidoglycan-binding protein [Opitutus sp.]
MNSRRRFIYTAGLAVAGLAAGGIPALAAPRPRAHTVQAGDTLSEIAARYDVSLAELKRRNGLRNDVIRPGQRLTLPESDALAAVVAATAELRIQRGRWRHVVVHHSAIEDGNAAAYDSAHRRRGMENGLAYHFVIGNGRDSPEGGIEIGPRWLRQLDGGHVRNATFNATGIGICLVGNFETRRPSEKQLATLTALIDWLRADAPLGARPKFTVHRWVDRNHTVCPGRYFPSVRLRLRYA